MRKAFANWQVRAFIYAFVFISELFAGLRIYELIDKTGDAIQAWAVTVLAGITAVYAMQTKTQADASMRMARGLSRPIISITNMSGRFGGILTVTITNVGTGPALNISVFFIGGAHRSETCWYSHLPVERDFRENINQRPGFDLRVIPAVPKSMVIANYKGVDGHKYHSKLELDWVKRKPDSELMDMVPGPHEIGEGHYQVQESNNDS